MRTVYPHPVVNGAAYGPVRDIFRQRCKRDRPLCQLDFRAERLLVARDCEALFLRSPTPDIVPTRLGGSRFLTAGC